MLKRSLAFLFLIIFAISLITAQEYKISVSTTQEIFESGKDISFIVSLHDSANKPIYDEVHIIIINGDVVIEESVQSNQPTSINLGENAMAGEWIISAEYGDVKSLPSTFFVKSSEKLDFKINEETLTITNIGNTEYTKTIKIIIGETPGAKKLNLKIGEKTSFTLVAPDGNYNIRIINENGETIFSQTNVALKGKGLTGEAVGILDEEAYRRSGITGGISPDEASDDALLNYVKNSKFVYVFILVIFGAMILLAIERRYKRRVGK